MLHLLNIIFCKIAECSTKVQNIVVVVHLLIFHTFSPARDQAGAKDFAESLFKTAFYCYFFHLWSAAH